MESLLRTKNSLKINRKSSLKFIQKAFSKNAQPTLEDIAEEWKADIPRLSRHEHKKTIQAIMHIITKLYCIVTHEYIISVMEYENISKRFPTDVELNDYMESKTQFEHDIDKYCMDNKHNVSASGIENIQPVLFKKGREHICSICCEYISNGALVYELPCGHVFCADNCLGKEINICYWLKKNPLCPNCKTEVFFFKNSVNKK
jgi:hypothetical protein